MTLTCITSITSTQINCIYNTINYTALNLTYQCIVDNDPNIINDKSAVIKSVDGVHAPRKTNNDVIGFFANKKTIQIFPKNLERFFRNLKALRIENCGLKEIFQSDLKKFPKLVYLRLPENEIEVIEEGLFAFNLNLEVVDFTDNNLIHVDPNVFDNLKKLSNFWFTNSSCVDFLALDSESQVRMGIHLVKKQCKSLEVTAMERDIRMLQFESMSVKNFAVKVEDFGKKLRSSKYEKFRPLRSEFEGLGDYSSCGGVSKYVRSTTASYTSTTVNYDSNYSDNLAQTSYNKYLKYLQIYNESSTRGYDYPSQYIPSTTERSSYNPHSHFSHQTIQCDSLNDLKSSQNSIQAALATFTTSQTDHKLEITKLDSKLTSQLNNIKHSQNSLKNSQDSLKISNNHVTKSIDDIKLAMNDLQASQIYVKDTLINLKTSQDVIEAALSDRANIEDLNEKILNLDQKVESLAGKIEKIEGKIGNFGHKIGIDVDEKMKGIEKRIVKKIEGIMRKILNEKLP